MSNRKYEIYDKIQLAERVEGINTKGLPLRYLAMFAAFLGGSYCVFQIWYPETIVPCVTSGCKVVQDFSIGGVSLWLVGVGYFFFMVGLAQNQNWKIFWAVSACAILADCLLLLVMLVLGSCLPCLGAAVFIGVLYGLALKGVCCRKPGIRLLVPLLAWGGLFLAAVASAGAEQFGVWQIAGEAQAERKVYFSPSCPACLDAIAFFRGRAAFIPISEREGDYAIIMATQAAMSEGWGFEEAFGQAMRPNSDPLPEQSLWSTLWIRGMLLRNKAEVFRMGVDRLPLIVINGFPQGANRQSASEGIGMENLLADPAALDTLLSCGDTQVGLCQ